MTLWEFHAQMDGWRLLNGVKKTGGTIDDDRLAAMGVEGF